MRHPSILPEDRVRHMADQQMTLYTTAGLTLLVKSFVFIKFILTFAGEVTQMRLSLAASEFL